MSELTGAELDLAVAKALNGDAFIVTDRGKPMWCVIYTEPEREYRNDLRRRERWEPSTSWTQLGPQIIEHKIGIWYDGEGWGAGRGQLSEYGDTPLIAACRAIVASKEEV